MTTAIEYLQALEEELKYLPSKEVRNVIKVYQEKINNALDYGEPIEKILKNLPTPEEVAKGVYDSKKVNYLDKRRKEYRRKELINGGVSLLLAIIVTLVFVGIIGYLGIVSFGMLEILPKFASADRIIMGGFVISYLLAMILVIVYLIDLGLLIITFLLGKFLITFKNLKIDLEALQSFSLNGLVDKLTKKKNVIGKTLLVIALVMLTFGATSVVGKGYLSRSFSDTVSSKNEEVIKIEESVSKIVLKNTKAKVMIKMGEEFRIIQNSEFDRHFQTEIVDHELTIKFDEHQNYDFLGLLTEPTIVITIEVPENLAIDLDIKLDTGQIGIDKTNLNKCEVNLQSGNIALKEVKIKEFIYTTEDAIANSNSCIYGKIQLDIKNGRLASSADHFQEAVINNASGEVSIKENQYSTLKLKNISGTVIIQDSQIDNYDYEGVASILTMSKIVSQYFNVKALNSSQITLTDLEAKLYTFDLNTGYVNAGKMIGDVSIIKSASNMTFSELSGNISGKVENSKLAVYNSFFDQLDVELTNCNLDLDGVTIKNIKVLGTKVQALLFDVFCDKMHLDLNGSNLQYHNDIDKPVGDIYIKSINTQYSIDKSVKYQSIKEE